MNRRLIINEEEKRRILNLHESRRSKELGFLFEDDNANNDVLLQGTDKDYDYKKVGDKYYFKLKDNPTSVAAKGYKTQGKFVDWTEATNQKAIDKISQLPTLSTVAQFQGPGEVDGSDETFDAPQTASTTAQTPTVASTTSTTAATPQTQLQLQTQQHQHLRQKTLMF